MKVFVIAGEVSGDILGGAVMAGLKALRPDVEFSGIGGVKMQAEGLQSLFSMDELSLMGIAEVLPKYAHLKRRIRETAEAVLAFKPDVLLTIDAPDFCLRVSRLVKAESNIRTVHYVAPSVWAWRPKRAQKMARSVDQVLALLPFEPPYMEAAGMACDFVGHPIAGQPVASLAEAEAYRQAAGVGAAPMVLLLPGSRRGEVERLSGVFAEAAALFVQSQPDAKFVLPTAGPVEALVREKVKDWPVQPIIIAAADKASKAAAMRAADIALAASGTVSLELAANETPMVIAYRMNWLTEKIVGAVLKTDTVTLVNLVSDTRVVPEFIGPRCQPRLIAEEMLKILNNPEMQKEALHLTMERLGKGGEAPGLRAARAILARA